MGDFWGIFPISPHFPGLTLLFQIHSFGGFIPIFVAFFPISMKIIIIFNFLLFPGGFFLVWGSFFGLFSPLLPIFPSFSRPDPTLLNCLFWEDYAHFGAIFSPLI